MKKKKPVLPDEMSLREASDFWDEHSLFDYDDVEEVHFDVNLKEKIHYFAVERKLATRIHQVARQRGVSTQTLVNLWLNSKLTEAA